MSDAWIELKGARANNLKSVTFRVPAPALRRGQLISMWLDRNAGTPGIPAFLLLHTAPTHGPAIDAMKGLRPWAKIVLMGISADDAFTFPALALTSHSFEVIGSAHNGPEFLAEALDIVARGDVTPMVEVFPKERVDEAYQRLLSGQLRFKAVVTY